MANPFYASEDIVFFETALLLGPRPGRQALTRFLKYAAMRALHRIDSA